MFLSQVMRRGDKCKWTPIENEDWNGGHVAAQQTLIEKNVIKLIGLSTWCWDFKQIRLAKHFMTSSAYN